MIPILSVAIVCIYQNVANAEFWASNSSSEDCGTIAKNNVGAICYFGNQSIHLSVSEMGNCENQILSCFTICTSYLGLAVYFSISLLDGKIMAL